MPDYTKSIKKIKEENPDVSDASISPAGPIASFFNRRASAIANPFTGNVTYFPQRIQGMSPDEFENTLTHELAHTRQIRGASPLQRIFNVGKFMFGGDEPYHQRSREMEAFQAERDRTSRLGLNLPDPVSGARDIQLPSELPVSQRRKPLDYFATERRRRGI